MKTIKAFLATALVTSFVVAPHVYAETAWQKDHPARTIDNVRIENQNRRIAHEVKEGEMSKGQAMALHQKEHAIRQEERDMARQNPGGHLTGTEQHALTQQLNATGQQIGH